LPLPTIPEGELPEDLWSILYLPLEDKLAVHSVLIDAQGRRWSDPQVVYDFQQIATIDPGPGRNLGNLKVAPTGDWLSVCVGYYESGAVWLLNLSSRKAHPVSACEGYQGCAVRSWSSDGRTIILELYPLTADPREFVMVNVATDMTAKLSVPQMTLDYASVYDVTFSPDGHSLVWTIRGADDNGETSQVWLTDEKGEQPRLLMSERGLIWNVSLSPDGSQIAYRFAAGRQQKPTVRLLSVEYQESRPLAPSSSDLFSNPAWAPNGSQVAMIQCTPTSEEANLGEHKCNVSVLDLRSEQVSQVVSLPGRVYRDISWSPNGELLTFVSAIDENLQVIWLYSLEMNESYPVSEYVRPSSAYSWLQLSFAGER